MDINITPKGTATTVIPARNIARAVNSAAQQLVTSLDTIAGIPTDFDREETSDSRSVFQAKTGKRLYDLKALEERSEDGFYVVEITPKDRDALGYLRQIKH